MIDEQLAIVSIKRSLGNCWRLCSLRVLIDGQSVGRVRENRTEEFSTPAGEHLITVILAPLNLLPVTLRESLNMASWPVRLQNGDRVELICTTDAEPLHPWHVHFLLYCLLCAPLASLGFIFAPVQAFWDVMAMEFLVMAVIGWTGMIIYFWRVYKTGSWHSTLYLTPVEQVSEERSEEEQP